VTDPTSDLPQVEPEYIAARRVLLDALAALAPHAQSLIVAGGQAIYLRTGEGELADTVAPYTTDGDLALDPERLGDAPELEAAMGSAQFTLKVNKDGSLEPGIWVRTVEIGGERFSVPVDLIVPAGVAPAGGRRGARLGVHGNRAARRVLGLEAALVDHDEMTITALEPGDDRSIVANVAGAAALLVAKLHKLHDRVASGKAGRLDDKDAADVIRLMQSTHPEEIGATLARLSTDEVAGTVSASALAYLGGLFGRRGGVGIRMAAGALRLGMPEERAEALSIAYTSVLLAAAPDEPSA